jgi:hypothetical protein
MKTKTTLGPGGGGGVSVPPTKTTAKQVRGKTAAVGPPPGDVEGLAPKKKKKLTKTKPLTAPAEVEEVKEEATKKKKKKKWKKAERSDPPPGQDDGPEDKGATKAGKRGKKKGAKKKKQKETKNVEGAESGATRTVPAEAGEKMKTTKGENESRRATVATPPLTAPADVPAPPSEAPPAPALNTPASTTAALPAIEEEATSRDTNGMARAEIEMAKLRALAAASAAPEVRADPRSALPAARRSAAECAAALQIKSVVRRGHISILLSVLSSVFFSLPILLFSKTFVSSLFFCLFLFKNLDALVIVLRAHARARHDAPPRISRASFARALERAAPRAHAGVPQASGSRAAAATLFDWLLSDVSDTSLLLRDAAVGVALLAFAGGDAAAVARSASALFDFFDHDGSGAIEESELVECVRAVLVLKGRLAGYSSASAALGAEGGGGIDVDAAERAAQRSADALALRAMEAYDDVNARCLSRAQFKHFIFSLAGIAQSAALPPPPWHRTLLRATASGR